MWRRRLGLGLATVLAVIAGVASASAITARSGNDTPAGPDAVQPDGSGASIPATVADPDGQAPFAVRVYRSKAGLTCPEAGRTRDGNFGRVDTDGDFEALDIEAAGSCADLSKAPMSLAINHYPAVGKIPARAVLFGVTTAQVSAIRLDLATGSRTVRIDGNAFITVVRDEALQGATLAATLADGSTKSYALTPDTAPATMPPDAATG
jgi:hypothetical protein